MHVFYYPKNKNNIFSVQWLEVNPFSLCFMERNIQYVCEYRCLCVFSWFFEPKQHTERTGLSLHSPKQSPHCWEILLLSWQTRRSWQRRSLLRRWTSQWSTGWWRPVLQELGLESCKWREEERKTRSLKSPFTCWVHCFNEVESEIFTHDILGPLISFNFTTSCIFRPHYCWQTSLTWSQTAPFKHAQRQKKLQRSLLQKLTLNRKNCYHSELRTAVWRPTRREWCRWTTQRCPSRA